MLALVGGSPVGKLVPGLSFELSERGKMTRWFCFFFVRHKWRYLSDFTSRQCQL